MSAAILRGPAAALICSAITAISPLAAEPIALRSYNAPIGESSNFRSFVGSVHGRSVWNGVVLDH